MYRPTPATLAAMVGISEQLAIDLGAPMHSKSVQNAQPGHAPAFEWVI